MKCSNKIYFRPYIPYNRPEERGLPFVCRIAPFENGFDIEWLDNSDPDGVHTLVCSKRESGEKAAELVLTGKTGRVEGLDTDTDYVFYVEAASGKRSADRLVRTGRIPEGTTVVNYLHPDDGIYDFSGKYLCSPSLVRTPKGRLIAGMDVFASNYPQNLTIHFVSEDNGKSWKYLNDIFGFYWSTLFTHRGKLYMIGMTTEYGNLHITRSDDDGETWATPTDLLFGANVLCYNGGVHRAPMHTVEYDGRVYTTCEYGCWKKGSHLPLVISFATGDDPMIAESWNVTEVMKFEGRWKEESGGKQGDTIEGNVIKAPDGKLLNILRYRNGKYLVTEINQKDLDAPLTYVGIEDAPVTSSMFRILKKGEKYLLITNHATEEALKVETHTYRNVLSVYESDDIKNWKFVRDIVNYEKESAKTTGFQYPTAFLEGDDAYLLIRSAFNNAHNFHDSNHMLFTKITLK